MQVGLPGQLFPSDYTVLRIGTDPGMSGESRGQVVNCSAKRWLLDFVGVGSVATAVNINLIERRVRTALELPLITRKGVSL